MKDWESFKHGVAWLVIACAAALAGACLCTSVGGCGIADPHTVVKFNPATGSFYLRDGKDHSLHVDNAEFNTETGQGKIEKLDVVSSASTVRAANVAQIIAVAEQQRAANEGIQIAMAGLSDLLGQVNQALTTLAPLASQAIDKAPDLTTTPADLIGVIGASEPGAP